MSLSAGSNQRVGRDVEAAALRDLLDQPRRATVTFVDGNAVEAIPVRARCQGDSYAFGTTVDDLAAREIVLLLDDGRYWWELRGISVRGLARRMDAVGLREGDVEQLTWYAVEPTRVLAWDYGSMRQV